MRARLALPAAALVLALLTALSTRNLGPDPVRLELGSLVSPYLSEGWSRSFRADVDPPAVVDGPTSFYYRTAPLNGGVLLPLTFAGSGRFTWRAHARVRSGVRVFIGGQPQGEILVTPTPWRDYTLELPALETQRSLDLTFALRALPLVRGNHGMPEVQVDAIEVQAPDGLHLDAGACATVGLVPVAILFLLWLLAVPPAWTIATAAAAAIATVLLARVAPLQVLSAIPRLVPPALALGALTFRLLPRLLGQRRLEIQWLSLLVVGGVLCHGSLAFFPDHNPPDLDIHVRRALDLGSVPFEYQALLRYGSQLPTASQDMGAATAALGEAVLIPYSPLPYIAYYLLALLGASLYWAVPVLNAILAMAVAPLLFATADRLWDRDSAWLATLLYTLDLAVWHHFGRAHAPAVFGFALATAALLYLASESDRLQDRGVQVKTGLVLGVAALGYSSLVVLFGLFGLLLLLLLGVDARALTPAARRGGVAVLLIGGVIAGGLFYFHYVPGLVFGVRGMEAEPDLFPGRSVYAIFRNESRQSLRLWVLGYATPLVAGLLAAPIALRRAKPEARPVLLAWLAAWALMVVLKDPLFLPKLLRWAKEDEFLSPLLCLLIGAGVGAVPRPRWRLAVGVAVLAVALNLEWRDFGYHANSLRL